QTPKPTAHVDSEVGPLRSVLLHRPGDELKRLTPRNNDSLLFDSIPWVSRAQEEHDQFAELLRSRGVEVLLLADLLTTALRDERAHAAGVDIAVDPRRLGPGLTDALRSYLSSADAETLARVLMSGMTFEELPASEGRSEEHTSELQSRENLVCRLLLEKKKHTAALTQPHASDPTWSPAS